MNYNDDWRNNISSEMLDRLAECRNKAMDVVEMASAMHEVNPDKTAEQCFERMLEWVGDWNGQYNITDKIYSNYEWYLKRVR